MDALALALRHRELAEKARAASAEEMKARDELVAALFPEGAPIGTNNEDLGSGYTLKVEVRPNVKLDEEKLPATMQRLANAGDLGAELAKRLVKHTPELRLGEFKKLPANFQRWFAKVVTISPGRPSVKLEGPA